MCCYMSRTHAQTPTHIGKPVSRGICKQPMSFARQRHSCSRWIPSIINPTDTQCKDRASIDNHPDSHTVSQSSSLLDHFSEYGQVYLYTQTSTHTHTQTRLCKCKESVSASNLWLIDILTTTQLYWAKYFETENSRAERQHPQRFVAITRNFEL